MIPHIRKYHAITVHHGKSAPTITLVEQLLKMPDGPDQIVVIDHALQPIQGLTPGARLKVVRPTNNSGYAGGVNFGLGILASQRINPNDIIVIMNNDLTLADSTFQALRRWWQAHPGLAIAGVERRTLNLFTGRTHGAHTAREPFWHLPYLDGVFLTAPLQVFVHLQGLPNHLFLYWEDILFSLRARQVGLSLQIISGVKINHRSQKTAQLASDQLYYLVRNGALVLSQSIPFPWRVLWKVFNPLRQAYHALRPAHQDTPIVREALRDAARQKTGPRPAVTI